VDVENVALADPVHDGDHRVWEPRDVKGNTYSAAWIATCRDLRYSFAVESVVVDRHLAARLSKLRTVTKRAICASVTPIMHAQTGE